MNPAHNPKGPQAPPKNSLHQRKHWIFDMDGTLTHSVHDFDEIRRQLGLPQGLPILESIATYPDERARALHRELQEIEWKLTQQARLQPGAHTLLTHLQQKNIPLGILTRNSRVNAIATLEACGILPFFQEEDILGRDCAAPKPSPEGIHRLLTRWNAQAETTVMLGDYLFDLQAGKRAGAMAIYTDFDRSEAWIDEADLTVHHLDELTRMLETGE